jgi:hypothetical protein
MTPQMQIAEVWLLDKHFRTAAKGSHFVIRRHLHPRQPRTG